MTSLTVVGGLYEERCTWPEWNRTFGSGGRAAAALVGHVDEIVFQTYASAEIAQKFGPQADADEVRFRPNASEVVVAFEYVHSLSTPVIVPALHRIVKQQTLAVKADVVLRFGMMEGTALVEADRCVYDPQSAFLPERFWDNGSRANRLAIVANRTEVTSLVGVDNPLDAAKRLLNEGVEVVVLKAGIQGAYVVTKDGAAAVPPNRSERVWTIGSGDVFAAVFAARWGVHRDDPIVAAESASIAVAVYAETMALPVPSIDALRQRAAPVNYVGGRVYLAGPFFTLGQRWMVDEARRALRDVGLSVFSPVHDVGPGPAAVVAPADLKALDECDLVFAILDGLDSGTLFELGYARSRGKPVYGFAQATSEEDLKMVEGSGCRVYSDFVTAVHHAAWRM